MESGLLAGTRPSSCIHPGCANGSLARRGHQAQVATPSQLARAAVVRVCRCDRDYRFSRAWSRCVEHELRPGTGAQSGAGRPRVAADLRRVDGDDRARALAPDKNIFRNFLTGFASAVRASPRRRTRPTNVVSSSNMGRQAAT